MTVRIATWNINSVTARLPKLLEWLESAQPDVLCLQELKCASDAFPYEEVRALGYETEAYGTGRWNGVAILSRLGFADVVRDLPDQPGYLADDAMLPVVEPRAIAATCGPVRVWSVYVPNGREVGHAHFRYKLDWLAALRTSVLEDAAGARPFAVLGDFNVAPTDEDVYDVADFVGATHVTEEERAALAALREAAWRTCCPARSSTTAPTPTGTTASWPSRRTAACGSTSSTATRPSRRRSPTATWTARRARARAPRTTRRWWWTWRSEAARYSPAAAFSAAVASRYWASR